MYNNPSTEPLYQRAERPELAFLKTRQFDSKHYRLFPSTLITMLQGLTRF